MGGDKRADGGGEVVMMVAMRLLIGDRNGFQVSELINGSANLTGHVWLC